MPVASLPHISFPSSLSPSFLPSFLSLSHPASRASLALASHGSSRPLSFLPLFFSSKSHSFPLRDSPRSSCCLCRSLGCSRVVARRAPSPSRLHASTSRRRHLLPLPPPSCVRLPLLDSHGRFSSSSPPVHLLRRCRQLYATDSSLRPPAAAVMQPRALQPVYQTPQAAAAVRCDRRRRRDATLSHD